MSRNLLGWGAEALAVGPGVVGVQNFDISEAGVSGRFMMDENQDAAVTLIRHRNKALTTGVCPVSLFGQNSETNPRLRRYVQINDPLEVSMVNLGAAAVDFRSALSTAPGQGDALPYSGDAMRDYQRDLICWGGDSAQDILPGAIYQFTFQLLQEGRAGFIVIGQALNTLSGLSVTEITHNNISLIDTSTAQPATAYDARNTAAILLGFPIAVNDRFTITVRNDTAAPIESVAVALTAG